MKTKTLYSCLVVILTAWPQLLSAQWSLVRFDEYNYFTRVATTSATSAIVAGIDGSGSFILRTNDGGATWDSIAVNSAANTYSISELYFTDVNTGFAGGLKNNFQALLKTTDNGTSWTEVTPDAAAINPIGAVSFIDPLNGYASDETNIYRTQDGGLSWTAMVPGFVMEDINFSDMNLGYACGSTAADAVVMKTQDGGMTWNTLLTASFPFFTGSSMQTLDVIDPDVVYCSGQYSNQLFRTINGGQTWDTITLSMIYGIQDYDFISANEGHVLSNMGEIFVTADGGLTWTLEYAVAGGAYGPSVFLVSVSFAGTTGYVCGSNGLIKKYTAGTTGLQPDEISNAAFIYPNPVSCNESIFIKGLHKGSILEIYTQSGQLTFRKDKINAMEKIKLNLPAGVYTLIVTAEGSRVRNKLVVVN